MEVSDYTERKSSMRLTQDNELRTGPDMDRYVIHLLKDMQGNVCAGVDCMELLTDGYQIAHKRYGEDITIYDLELLCGACHAKDHNLKSCRGLLRY
jgi:hypothetical protein